MADWNKAGKVGWSRSLRWWKHGGVLHISVVFSWDLGHAEELARSHKGKVVAGGPAVKLCGAPWADETPEETPFDVLAMHNPLATFTTRGCPNSCAYCAVPKLEGVFRELKTWKLNPIVCDNNLVAASRKHFARVIESLRPFPFVDFNQGFEAGRFTPWHANEIAKLHHPKVRFAFDYAANEKSVADAIQTARSAGLRNRDLGVYVLLGWKDTPEDALYRLEKVREWGIRPNPMRYQPLDVYRRNDYVAPGWNERLLRDVMKYYSRLRWLEHLTFEEYQKSDDLPLLEALHG